MITIGIPCYGQAEFLPDAIESARSQTIPCETIVVIDGSNDNSKEVAERYKGIKIIDQVNKGLASARNTAIMNMQGDYFLPLDADDILQDNAAERLRWIAEVTDADIIAPSIKCFGVGNETITLMPDPTLNDFKAGNRIPYCSMIKRSALLEVGGYSPRMDKGWEDLHLWINLLSRGKRIVTTADPLVLYRTKQTSMWTEAEKHRDELMAQIYKDFPHFK